MGTNLIPVDGERAERERQRRERERQRRWLYDMRHGIRNHHTRPDGRRNDRVAFHEQPFIMWDGEAATDAGYCLFGSSAGHEVCKPHLTTEDCFDLLLEAKRENPYSIFVIFGGRYDWDEICRQSMPLSRQSRLEYTGSVFWHGYKLTKKRGKIFTIARDGVTVTVFEIFGWFMRSYARALTKYQVGPWANVDESLTADVESIPAELGLRDKVAYLTAIRGHELTEAETIALFKAERGTFMWDEIDLIKRYMRIELKYGPVLMDRIRDIVLAAGFSPRAWYGPSALATQALTRNKVGKHMAECPPEVNDAACFAYAGGRFETIRGGIFTQPVTQKDMNSAYMRAALELPSLAGGKWREGREFEPGKFALYQIEYDARDFTSKYTWQQNRKQQQLHPLFRRTKNGNVTWTYHVKGWYWAPEAGLVAGDPRARFLKAWVFEPANSVKPFAFVLDMYEKRMKLENLPVSNPSRVAGQAFKWALASIYGQLCRSVGWDVKNRRPPRNHQIEWAGFITSWVRAEMYKAAVACGDKLLSIDTDSVTALCDVDLPEGKALGEWKTTVAEHGGVIFQNGVYALRDGDGWVSPKSRGVETPRSGIPLISPDMMVAAIRERKEIRLKPKRRYVSTLMALNGQFAHQGEWKEHPADRLSFGGGGKRHHSCGRLCVDTQEALGESDAHFFSLPPAGMLDSVNPLLAGEPLSVAYPLPWKQQCNRADRMLLEDILWIPDDPANMDSEDRYLAELIEGQERGTRDVPVVGNDLVKGDHDGNGTRDRAEGSHGRGRSTTVPR